MFLSQNGNMLDKLCQYLKVHEQRSWMNLNSVPLLLRTILCYPEIHIPTSQLPMPIHLPLCDS